MLPRIKQWLCLWLMCLVKSWSASLDTNLECKEVISSSGVSVVECTLVIPKAERTAQISSCLDTEHEEFCVQVNLDASYRRKAVNAEKAKQSSSSTPNGDIRVGSYTYKEPFHEHYAKEVVRILRKRSNSFDSVHIQEQINWYADLGWAHRHVLEQAVDDADAAQETVRAVEAFQQARTLLLHLNDKIQLASIYISIGETYSLSPDPSHYSANKHYFERAEVLYRELMQSESGNVENKIEVTISWADTCIRLGVAHLNGDSIAFNDFMQVDEAVFDASMTQLQDASDRAEGLFEKAQELLSEIIDDASALQKPQIMQHLANAKQNLATARTMKGDSESSIKLLNEAFSLYSSILPPASTAESDSLETADMRAAMGEVLLALADTYLQLGMYDASKENFRRMTSWYEEFNLAPPPEPKVGDTSAIEEMIDSHESMLKQYAEVVNGMTDEGYFDELSGEYYYEKNDAYEGDLHSILGGLHMAMGDDVAASSHLSQAIQLYELNGETQERNTADAKFNLAMLYFRIREFQESERLYSEAIDIYRLVVGDGVNPFQDDALASSVMFDTGKHGNTRKTTESHKKHSSIHQELIDLEEYRQSLLNETLGGDEL